jgi:hypothetical protein
MSRNPIALTARGPGGDKDYRHLKTDSAGNLLISGSVASGGTTQITDGSQEASITDVGGKRGLDVNVIDLTIDHSNDSVRVGDGTNFVGTTLEGGVRGLNSYLTNELISTNSKAYKTIIDEVSATLSYIGKAEPGTATSSASWQIQRLSVSGGVTSIEFAGGAATFSQIWANRAGLTYS